jgi:hypothetical protein
MMNVTHADSVSVARGIRRLGEERDEKIVAAFIRFAEKNGQSFSSPSDMERVAFAFASGWRAHHRSHRGRKQRESYGPVIDSRP